MSKTKVQSPAKTWKEIRLGNDEYIPVQIRDRVIPLYCGRYDTYGEAIQASIRIVSEYLNYNGKCPSIEVVECCDEL